MAISSIAEIATSIGTASVGGDSNGNNSGGDQEQHINVLLKDRIPATTDGADSGGAGDAATTPQESKL